MKIFGLAFGFCACAFGVSAETLTYDCKLKTREGGNFMSDRVIFSVDTDAKQAMVYDAMIDYYEGAPKAAAFKQRGNGKYQLKWSVKASAINVQSLKINYVGTFDPNALKLTVSGKIQNLNSMDRPGGSGVCALVKGESLF